MAEAYEKIKHKPDDLPENEIRVKANTPLGRYLKRVHFLLYSEGATQKEVVIRGVSNAMETVVKLSELIKHRFKGLHQENKIEEHEFVDEYEPLYEGLDKLRFTRNVTMLSVTLSVAAKDTNSIGYQKPIPESEVTPYEETATRPAKEPRESTDKESPRGRGRGRGRGGRGRGGRGRGRSDALVKVGDAAGKTPDEQKVSETRRGGRGGRGRGRGAQN